MKEKFQALSSALLHREHQKVGRGTAERRVVRSVCVPIKFFKFFSQSLSGNLSLSLLAFCFNYMVTVGAQRAERGKHPQGDFTVSMRTPPRLGH